MRVIIKGIPPWDGKWGLPDFYFSNRELNTIKEISGLRAGELIEALDLNDAAAYVAVAAVALERAGKVVDVDQLWDAPVGTIGLTLDDEDADAVPLDETSGFVPSANDGSSTHDSESGSES